MTRPRLQDDTLGRLNGLVDDIENIIESKDMDNSRYHGDNGNVTQDRVINEGLKLLRRRYNNGDLPL